jgi:hypothetical protein
MVWRGTHLHGAASAVGNIDPAEEHWYAEDAIRVLTVPLADNLRCTAEKTQRCQIRRDETLGPHEGRDVALHVRQHPERHVGHSGTPFAHIGARGSIGLQRVRRAEASYYRVNQAMESKAKPMYNHLTRRGYGISWKALIPKGQEKELQAQ